MADGAPYRLQRRPLQVNTTSSTDDLDPPPEGAGLHGLPLVSITHGLQPRRGADRGPTSRFLGGGPPDTQQPQHHSITTRSRIYTAVLPFHIDAHVFVMVFIGIESRVPLERHTYVEMLRPRFPRYSLTSLSACHYPAPEGTTKP
ncbi:hypothetical protein EYF80_044848 [Liparis tanakae]|uniref:Uncharacterized protein n=1 Tax=Liparis tanakae TaxID=230148 RepID=A0A4Z2FUS4_9TELE|nr:hypothetical protein EYF80_044848 [Liparis tanakae]